MPLDREYLATYRKDPSAVLDYSISLATWLGDGETVVSHSWAVDNEATVNSSSESAGVLTAWISGGTLGADVTATVTFTTSAGRTDERSILLRMVER